ncbi:MAG: hypothetical protein ABH854_03330 [Candidatus Diapherotrites archaeon]|nr:hypothetical protein [Candidatus Micrarchaeota archaeon]MBU1939502.1 hypothetical protein [Candidatus Micrarchaeota archaeon]
MAKKGESKGQKRLSVAKVRFLPRKKSTWTIRGRAGPHSSDSSVPLGFALRELLKVCGTMKEVKFMLRERIVIVNGKAASDYRLAVGLFDIVEITKEKKRYRAMFDNKARLFFREIDIKGKTETLVKVRGKSVLKKGKVQLLTNSGTTLLAQGKNVKVGDSILLGLPKNNFTGTYAMKEGMLAYVIGGTHAGTIAKIKGIIPGTMVRKTSITLEGKGTEFKTVDKNVFVIGEKEAAIDMGKEAA